MERTNAMLLLAVIVALAIVGCRRDPSTTTTVSTGQAGGSGTEWVAQCSGWYPDWITRYPPPAEYPAFQISQGYPLGKLAFDEGPDGSATNIRWESPDPVTAVAQAPWLAYDFHLPAERMNYLSALKDYALEGMPEVDFVAQKNKKRRWYHVPMMTSNPNARREPYHGVTKERRLRSGEHDWIIDGTGGSNNLDSFGIGYYNRLGGYTIGQVFHDPDPSLANPAKGQFIDGAVVFKLLFAEYDATKIVTSLNPLIDAPEWEVLDVFAANQDPPIEVKKRVRLIQLDIAVKDPRAATTGWVFATYVYDKALPGDPWRRLTPVGLQWGNDPSVSVGSGGTLSQSWINPNAPAVYRNQDTGVYGGEGGRLNGPIDNPASSCMSCHSTAQVRPGAATLRAFRGTNETPENCTSNAQKQIWFRNLGGHQPFGVMSNNGNGCNLLSPQPTPPPTVHALDYSLQLTQGLVTSLFFKDPNPCQGTTYAKTKSMQLAALRAPELRSMRGHELTRDAAADFNRVAVDPMWVKQLEKEERPGGGR